MTLGYAIFGSYEYTDDQFYGAYIDQKKANEAFEKILQDPYRWESSFSFLTIDLDTGRTIAREAHQHRRPED